jgi:hypothetical protein
VIVEWFLGVLVSLVETLTSALPAFPVPDWLSTLGSGIGSVITAAASMSYWLPFQVAIAVAVSWLACLAVAWGVKIVRIIGSFLTAGGGSAG